MLVIYGGQDPLMPSEWTDRALLQACKMGDVIQIQLQPQRRGPDIDLPAVMGWINARFNGDPAPNDCAAFLAAHGSPGDGG
jgi:hypothetical protein